MFFGMILVHFTFSFHFVIYYDLNHDGYWWFVQRGFIPSATISIKSALFMMGHANALSGCLSIFERA
jgi:hypothetical protein